MIKYISSPLFVIFVTSCFFINISVADVETLQIISDEIAKDNSNGNSIPVSVDSLTQLNSNSSGLNVDNARDLLEKTAKTMFSQINANHDEIVLNPAKAKSLFIDFLEPHINFDIIVKIVMGVKNWKAASPIEKSDFKQAYRDMLLRTYSKALSVYLGDREVKLKSDLMSFYLDDDKNENSTNENRAIVYSKIKTGKNKIIKVKYYMYRSGRNNQSNWKVYNIFVEGVSVINVHREIYKKQIEESGVRSLISSIEQKNHTMTAEAN